MSSLTLATAFLAGLLGSTHCVVMCGGIAAALGTASGPGARTWCTLLYQLGRIGGYAIIGAVFGALGLAAGFGTTVARWSQVLRLATAAVIVLIGLNIAAGRGTQTAWLRAPERWGARLWRRLAPATRVALPRRPVVRALALGLAWGWMPCGLVYSALLAATVAGRSLDGALTMTAFGLGTLPAMLGAGHLGAWLPRPGGALARVAGAVIVACGLWTAAVPIAELRGSNLHAHHEHQGMDMNMDMSMPDMPMP